MATMDLSIHQVLGKHLEALCRANHGTTQLSPWGSVRNRGNITLRGCAHGRATQAAYFLGFPPKTPKMTTSGPNSGSRAQNLGLGQMRSFLVVLEGFTPNVTTSGPNPWFWAQNHGFGPDVVIFSLTPPGASQKPS